MLKRESAHVGDEYPIHDQLIVGKRGDLGALNKSWTDCMDICPQQTASGGRNPKRCESARHRAAEEKCARAFVEGVQRELGAYRAGGMSTGCSTKTNCRL